ncbi:hypothetical protein Tco_0450688 [Tanacetum coccineum]
METQKPLLKDEDGEEVDVHMYRSMIGSLMYLTSLRPDIMFAVCACARYQVNPKVSHLHAVKKIFRYLKGQPKLSLWYPKDSPFYLVAYTDSDYVGASLDRKSTTGDLLTKAFDLTVNPTIYISCIEQFWSIGVVKTINGEVQLHALVDGKKIIISEASMRRDLKLEDEEGSVNLTDPYHTPTIIQPSTQPQKTQKPRKPKRKDTQVPQRSDPSDNVADEAVHKELGDSLVRVATTTSSLEAECQETMGDTIAQTRFENVSKLSNDSLLARGNTLRSDEDRLKLDELMALCTTLQKRVLDLEKTKTTQANEIASLKMRVKKLEKKRSSRTHKLKRLYKVGLTAMVESSSDEEDLDDADNEMFDVNVLNGEEVFVAGQNENVVEEVVDAAQVSTAATTVTITTEEITLAQALEALKTSKPKVKGIVFQEPDKSTTTTTISSQQSQDKGKGIMIEEPVKPMKKKVQIMLDEEAALKLQAEFDEEERLAREKAEKEKEANIALIEEWDDIQAKIDVDYQLAERLQAQEQEELSVKEKAKLFQQLLEKRRKHFAAKSAEEKRNKPPTQAQQRKIMCTYLKNIEGKKLKDLKNKSFDSIQKMFDRAFKRVNTFVDFRTDLVEGSSKRAGEELEQESTKKQKVDEDKDTAELQSLMEVIPDEEEVTIDTVTLATKSPKIVDWKIHKEGKKSYYQIVRADGKSQMYMIFSQMLKSFDREDLEDLYKLVKARYGSTRPVESMDYLLWNDLKTITFLDDAVYVDLHAGRKEISSYTTYNYRYAEQEASGVNAANEEVSTAELVSTAYLKFNSIKDAKKLLEFVEKTFGRNEATKKTQRNPLKQQYENFTTPSSEMLDQTFDRLQKFASQLELLGEKILQEDVNQKLLRSLSLEWNTYAVVWRNKSDLDTMSMDDLYNNLKVYEPEVKRMSSSSSSTQNMAFVSSLNNNTSSTNKAVNTAHGVFTASTQVNIANSTNINNLSVGN